ncbi:uncharacterized protein LOC121335769 [Onychostruthus taczanowskii]|uniref:uncharacterized protein LOC121335769 n=1 Tax=Onychostruthus taczanowskii TaxID=356909 RepID=UPI001B801F75|nr:uncharacterized protein LOC121335769 [Onychostruthus taczanowskii]
MEFGRLSLSAGAYGPVGWAGAGGRGRAEAVPAAGAQVDGHLHLRAGLKGLGLSRSPPQEHGKGGGPAAVPHAPVGPCPGSSGFSASSEFSAALGLSLPKAGNPAQGYRGLLDIVCHVGKESDTPFFRNCHAACSARKGKTGARGAEGGRCRQRCPLRMAAGPKLRSLSSHVRPSSRALLRRAVPGPAPCRTEVPGATEALPRGCRGRRPRAPFAVPRERRERRWLLQQRFLFLCGRSETTAACFGTLPAEFELRPVGKISLGKITEEAYSEHQESSGERERKHGTESTIWERNPGSTRLSQKGRKQQRKMKDVKGKRSKQFH